MNYSFDERDRLKTVTDSDHRTTTYFYDAANRLTRTELPNGVVELRQHNSVNQLQLLKTVKLNATGSETVLTSYGYSLDKVGNRLSMIDQTGRKVNYTYDELYRLTQEQVTEGSTLTRTTDFTYDNVGNRLSQSEIAGSTSQQTTYQYDANDRLEWEKVNGTLKTSYQYDANGNTIAKSEMGVGTTTYDWNQDGRLIGVLMADGKAIAYRYDSEGIRTSATVDGVTTDYLVDKNRDYAQVLEERVNGNLAVNYVYGLDLISQERGSQTSFYLVDGLGSTTALTDANGNLTDTYTYDAFGETESQAGATENSYLFAGEQFDRQLGQYYLRQRYYNAESGEFTRKDIHEGSLGNPLSLHKYLYAHNNPVNFTDPTGLFTVAEMNAVNTIRTTLSGTQVASSNYIFSSSQKGRDYGADDFVGDFVKEIGWAVIMPVLGMAVTKVPQFLGGSRLASRLEKIWGTPDSAVLRANMKNAGIHPPRLPNAAHHIVPGTQNQQDAIIARTHLAKLGINSNDADNGVFLEFRKAGQSTIGSGSIHNDIHTDVYYAEIRRRLLQARNESQARQVLKQIAVELRSDSFPY